MLNRKWKQRERLRQLRLEEYKRQRLLSKQKRVSVKSGAKTRNSICRIILGMDRRGVLHIRELLVSGSVQMTSKSQYCMTMFVFNRIWRCGISE